MIFIFNTILKSENIRKNEPLKNHCTFKVGGECEYFLTPQSIDELSKIIKNCKAENTEYFILGNGSNLLFTDDFHSGAYISLLGLNEITIEDDVVTASSGARLTNVCNLAASDSLSGLEELSGIPGTVGGAVYMNAGAYGGEIKDTLIKSTCLSKSGEILTLSNEEHKFGYRTSVFQENGCIVLSSSFKLKKGDKEEIKSKMAELLKRRNDKQPLNFPSAGSTFKRPEGFFAGKLIEDSGLKGFSVGGAQISEKHCGFVINKGNATATDILSLISHVQKTVYEKFQVNLETEVKII